MSPLQIVILGGLAIIAVVKTFILPLLSPIRKLPSPVQAPAHKRFLVEPSPEQLEQWASEIPNEGLIRYRGILNKERILVTEPSALHDILTVHPYSFRKPPAITKIIRSLLGDGLVVVEGDAHKTQKRALQPAFKLPKIKALYPIFWQKAEELVRALAQDAKSNKTAGTAASSSVNIAEEINRVTLDIIGIAGFGLDFGCLANPSNKLASDYTRGFAPSKDAQVYRMLALVFPESILDRLPLRRNQELRSAVSAVKRCAGDAIRSRQTPPASREKDVEASKDVLGVLMEDGGVTDVESLINQSMTFLGAGHDTVAASLTCAIYELCMNPEIQTKLRSEVRSSIACPLGRTAGETVDIESMPYLAAVCNEIFRMHPPIPFIQRQSIEPVTVGGFALPKGVSTLTSTRILNRSSKLWSSDPARFNPDRWLNDLSGGATDRYASMTFSHGARTCIGERFGRAEVKHLLAGIVGSFSCEMVGTGADRMSQTLQMEHGIVSRPIGGLWVKLEYLGEW